MKANKLTKFVGGIMTFADEHQRELMLGGAIAGTVITTVLSWRAGIKADKVIREHKQILEGNEKDMIEGGASEEQINEMKKKITIETAKKLAPIVAPPMVSATGTIISVIGGYKVASKQIAVLSSLYTMGEKAFSEYQDKAKELIGPKKEQQIRDEVSADKVKNNPPVENYILQTGHGQVLCLDDYSGRYFYSDPEYIRKCVNDINEQLHGDIYVSLNEFYEKLGLSNVKLGEDIGFCEEDGNVSVAFSATLTSIGDRDNIPCLVLNYDVSPKYGFGDFSGNSWRFRR